MKNLKIVQWNSATCWGGAEIRLTEICENLFTRGYEIYLICRRNSPLYNWARKKDFITLDGSASANSGDLINAIKLGLKIKKWQADIIHVHAGKDYFPAVVAGIVSGCPVVIHRHLFRPLSQLTQWICNRWKVVFVGVSNAVVNSLKNCGIEPEKIFFIPMGVDSKRILDINVNLEKIEKIKKDLQINNEQKVILSVGHLYKSKGHEDLIKVINKIKHKYPNVVLLIVGEGEMRSQIESLIKKLKIEENVKLLGARNDVPLLLNICEFFALLSWEDPFPGAMIEALAAGKPVVAYCAGGVPEIVKHNETGFLAEPRNIDSVVSFFDRLLSNQELVKEMGLNAKKDFMNRLSIEKTIEDLEKLYNILLKL